MTLNVLQVVLLVVGFLSMVWSFLVMRRLRQLVSEKKTLATLLETFRHYDLESQKRVKHLENRTQDLYDSWQEALEKGEELKKDLAYFFDRGEALLNDLEPHLRRKEIEPGQRPELKVVSPFPLHKASS